MNFRVSFTTALIVAIALAGCGTPAGDQSSGTPLPSDSAEPSARETSTAFAIPERPSDIPTDGTCEEDRRCFGVLDPGSFQTEFLDPNFTFEITEAGWVNGRSSGGQLDLVPVDAPGDELFFLQRVSAREADGGRVAGVGATAAELGEWLGDRRDLMVEPLGAVSIGGLEGFAFDLTVRADAPPTLDGCPTEQCVMLVGGQDPAEMSSWVWDIALWRGAAMRVWLLDATDQVVAFEATAWDGSQLEDFLARVQPIIESVQFVDG
jgi:hypothetical protein